MVALARYARALEAGLPSDAFADQEVAEVPPSPPPIPANLPLPSDETSNALFKDTINQEIFNLTENLKRSLTLTGAETRFFGCSSSVTLLADTAKIPEEVGSSPEPPRHGAMPVNVQLRPEYWSVHPWEKSVPPERPSFIFPPPDLLTELVRLYFAHLDLCISLLHRPSFERSIAAGLHHSDVGFAGVVLAVCSVASRYTDDKRVLLEEYPTRHSSGYKWFRQLRLFNEDYPRVPSLYDLQAICLATVYLQGSSKPELCWYLVGLGIRAAQDIGLNKKVPGPPTIENELRKRVFWLLVLEESAVSSAVGRPPATTLSDFDVDLPVEVDSEYWENPDPKLAFKQPPGVPSKVTFFCFVVKLFKIVYSSQRTFYAVQRPDPPLGISAKEWDRVNLANLDSELNSWIDALPEFLRWNPTRPADEFFDQSAMLLAAYYHVQIFLHRPFIGVTDDPVLALSSLAICTNAARACARIMEAHAQKGFIPTPQNQIALFTSGLMLTLHVWRARLAGHPLSDEARELKSVQSCINVLRTYEDSDELSKPFNMFNSMESVGYDLSLSEHLDELEAMWAQIQTAAPGPALQANAASPDITNALFDPSLMVMGQRSPPSALGIASSMVDRPLEGNIVPIRFDEWQQYLANAGGFTVLDLPLGGASGGGHGFNFP
ncbi:hypothetical protein MD484_g2697, partial [Candolleomyces efflorescens]